MDVCLLCVLSVRGLCDELITCPEESYRLWRVDVCDHETSWYKESIAHAGLQSQRNKQTTIKVSKIHLINERVGPGSSVGIARAGRSGD
jgi:hypothetical protein